MLRLDADLSDFYAAVAADAQRPTHGSESKFDIDLHASPVAMPAACRFACKSQEESPAHKWRRCSSAKSFHSLVNPGVAPQPHHEYAPRFDSGAATLASPTILPAGDEGEQAEYRAELFDRGGDIVCKGVVDTGRGWPRPKSDKDIQL